MLAATLALLLQGDAESALRKLEERARPVRTVSADFVQHRRTPLMKEPLKSSGTLHYRRDPERLVFLFTSPRASVVHLDRSWYRVYRPEARQLEEFELGDSESARWLFMAFHPRVDDVAKAFRLKTDGADIAFEPRGGAVIKRLSMRVEGDVVRRIEYVDADDEEVTFELSSLAIDPKVAPETFDLKVPDGVRVLRHRKKE